MQIIKKKHTNERLYSYTLSHTATQMHTFTSKREQGKRFSNQTEQKKRKDEPITFTTITDEEFLVGLKTKQKKKKRSSKPKRQSKTNSV